MGKYRKSFFIVFVIFLFLLFDNVSAATLTSYSFEYDNCSASNKFGYTMIDSQNNWIPYTGGIGSVINHVPNSFQFDFKYDLTGMKYYDVKFTMTGYDIYSSVNSSMITIGNGSFCGDMSNSNVALVSFTKSSSSSSRYKVMTLRIYSATAVSNWGVHFENTSALAGPENFGISSITINEVDLSNTDAIIDNQNSNANSIIENDKQNTNDIINNQNQNNEELKDTINNNFNDCRPSKNLWNNDTYFTNVESGLTRTETGFTFYRGNITGGRYVANYIQVEKGKTYTFSIDGGSSNSPLIIYLDNVYGTTLAQGVNTLTYTSTESTTLIFTIALGSPVSSVAISNIQVELGSVKTSFEPFGQEICVNKLDDVNSSINGLTGAITDDSPPDINNFISGLQGLVNDSPIATLILMPFTLLNRYVEGFSGNCTPINLGNLYGTDIKMSCINISSIVGSNLWSIIDGLISIFMIYNIAMMFVSVFNDITSLRDTFDSLYTPQHAKTLGKHTSEVA